MNQYRRNQLDDIRDAATDILAEYEISPDKIEFIADLDCIVFRVSLVDQPREYLALRFYPSDYGGVCEISQELHWLESLSRDTELLVPNPLRSRDGSLALKLEPVIHDMDCCALMSWVPGRRFSRGLTSNCSTQASSSSNTDIICHGLTVVTTSVIVIHLNAVA